MSPKNLNWFVPCQVAAGVLAVLAGWFTSARADVFTQVPEATSGGYQLLYTLPVSDVANYASSNPAYSVDNSAQLTGSISRVAYYMELQTATGELQYAYASMDAFTQNVKLLGIPTAASGAYFNQSVYNMHVFSNVTGITTGTVETGNLEFFHTDYTADSVAGVPNADPNAAIYGDIFDWGDDPDGPHGVGERGSFQIANPLRSQEVICYNNWGGDGGEGDIGLGNAPVTPLIPNPDWTMFENAASYTIKNIQVLVQPGAAPARIQVMPLGDSITDGFQSVIGGGYRTPLYSALGTTGRTYDFVGSSGDNRSTLLNAASEQQHEGHNGYYIDDLTANIAGTNDAGGNDGGYWLTDNPGIQPKYILVYVGTNDIGAGLDPTATDPSDSQFALDLTGRLERLLNTIISQRPTAHILLAGTVPVRSTPTTVARTALFDADMQSLVLTNPAYAGKLTYVNQHDSFLNVDGTVNTTLYADSLHPNDAGYAVMATVWFNAINTLDTALPSISPLTATTVNPSSTTISGTLNPSGQAAAFYLQYGLTTSYGTATPVQQIAAAMYAAVPISIPLTGLNPGATYHFQLVATTGAGTSVTQDGVFIAGSSAPLITSTLSASATEDLPFTYRTTVSDNPFAFSATGLPNGLSINGATGVISGRPSMSGTFSVGLSVTGGAGTAAATLTLKVAAIDPVTTLVANRFQVRVGTGKIGEFTVKLASARNDKITVNYKISGSAVNGTDYALLTGKLKFNPGSTVERIKIVPREDSEGEAGKRVILTLLPGVGYKVGSQHKGNVIILPRS